MNIRWAHSPDSPRPQRLPFRNDHPPASTASGLGRDGARYGRTGIIHTPHGDIRTPAFVPVGTQAAMKAVLPEQMKDLGAQCLLANAFHLFERPGEDVLDAAGGLARFMNWDGPRSPILAVSK